MLIMKGIAPEHICRLLADCSGRVEMVNSRGIYLYLSNIRVLLCDRDAGIVPNGAALESFRQLTGFMQPGQYIRCKNSVLQTEAGTVSLQLQMARQDLQSCIPSREALEKAATVLKNRTVTTGLAPLILEKLPENNPYCLLAKPLLEALMEALAASDLPEIEKNAEALLGLGSGLTPSGDDVLSGLMYGLRHSPLRQQPATRTLTQCLQTVAAQRTNAVSADYLKALSMDAPFEKMAMAWRDPATHAAGLLAIGSNSGSEMLLGLLLAGELLQKISSRSC